MWGLWTSVQASSLSLCCFQVSNGTVLNTIGTVKLIKTQGRRIHGPRELVESMRKSGDLIPPLEVRDTSGRGNGKRTVS